MKEIIWTTLKGQSLALAAREAGYDLTMYEEYPKEVQETLRYHAIKNVLRNLCSAYEAETRKSLQEVKQGVYVICLSDPFTIQYGSKRSNVLYIGRGSIVGRLKSHLELSLFHVMMSLAGANFDFYLAEPIDEGGDGYFKQLEYELLEHFKRAIGDGKFPLLNKNAGTNRGLKLGPGWKKPIKSAGKRPTWAIAPTGRRPIHPLEG